MANIRAHVIVQGRVQGVCFRSETQYEARRLGLTGWVKNLRDGRVEAMFEGDEESVERAIAWCRTGPPSSIVTDVAVERGPYSGSFDGFSVTF